MRLMTAILWGSAALGICVGGALASETERGWQGKFVEGEGFLFERTVRGVKEVAVIDHALLNSADARKLDEYTAVLQGAYVKPGSLRRKGEDVPTTIHGPVSLFDAITASGRKRLGADINSFDRVLLAINRVMGRADSDTSRATIMLLINSADHTVSR